MKVLVDCVPLTVGGGVQVAIGLLLGLQRQTAMAWWAVVPLALKRAMPAELVDDVRIHYVTRRSQADRIWLTPYLMLLERRFSPDVVFTVFGPPFFRAKGPHLVGFALPRLIYDRDASMPRETLLDRLGIRARGVLFRQADHIVVETETARVRLSGRVGIPLQRISVIPNSTNPLLKPVADRPPARNYRYAVLIPSAYYWHKNLEIVPHVAAAIRRRAPDLDFVFRFTLPEQGADWLRIKLEATRLGVGLAVETLGVVNITALAQAYCDASAVYLPTLWEVSTAVYPESFLFRRPLVTTNVDFARELCGEGAIFVHPRDPEDAAARFVELATSPTMTTHMADAGTRQLASAYLTSEQKLRLQLELIAKVAAVGPSLVVPPPDAALAAAGAWKTAAVDFHSNLAPEWDDKYLKGSFRKRAAFFVTEILPLLAQSKGNWLDVGCGSGYFSRLLAVQGNTVLGIDASEPMIETARRIFERLPLGGEDVRFNVIETAERLGFPEEIFDGVLCLSVLEYLHHPDKCLDEVNRVLKPGGTLVISLPHRFSLIRFTQRALYSSLGRIVPRNWEYATLSRYDATWRSLKSVLMSHGFRTIKVTGFDSAVPETLLKLVPPSLMFAIATKEAYVTNLGKAKDIPL